MTISYTFPDNQFFLLHIVETLWSGEEKKTKKDLESTLRYIMEMVFVFSMNLTQSNISDMGKEKPWHMLLAEFKRAMEQCVEFCLRYLIHSMDHL